MEAHSLNGTKRNEIGKNANNRLRQQGYIPAVLYAHGKSEQLQVLKSDFIKLFKGHISESILIDLKLDNKLEKVYVKDYQKDPIKGDVIHIDFFKVNLQEKITTKVPLSFEGKAAGLVDGGILEIHEREVEIEVLPNELPETITVDVTKLVVGKSICTKDLKATGSLKYLLDQDVPIVSVVLPRAEVAAAEAVVAAEAAPEAKPAGDKK